MAQVFALPPGFSTTPPGSQPVPQAGPLPAGHFALPEGFTTSPPQRTAPPSAFDQAAQSMPLFGQIYSAGKTAVDALNRGGAPGPNERRGNLAPVIRNEQTGALRLAWPQAALDAASALQLPGDVASGQTPLDPRVPYAQQDPATLGRASTLASMAATSGSTLAGAGMANPGARAIIGQDGRSLPGLVTADLMRSGVTPAAINGQVAGLGPGAVLADINPVLQARAAKLASLPQQSRAIVTDTLQARKDAAGPRIQAAMADIAGPEPVPSAVAAGIQARKDAISPYYDKAIDGAKGPVATQSIVQNLNGNVAMMRGPAQKALQQVRTMFNVPAEISDATKQTITTDPRTVFEIRNAIDGMMATETNPKVIGALQNVRQRVDSALGAAVPGLKTVDAYWQEQARQTEGFDYGRAALQHGQAPVHPDDLGLAMQQTAMPATVGPMSRPSQYPTMIRQGMLSKMYEIIGNNVNDRISLQKIITGDGKWNYQKIQAAFGADRAKQLLGLFNSEATKGATENLALSGSKTDMMREGAQGLEATAPTTANRGPLRALFNMDFGDAAYAGVNKLTGGAFQAAREARNAQIARTLMTPAGGFGVGPGSAPTLFGPPLLPRAAVIPATTELVKKNRDDLARALGLY